MARNIIGNYGLTEKELMDFHRPRMNALIEAGADMLACETIPSLIEAQAIAKLLKEFPNVTAWVSFSARDEKHISEGQIFADCVKQLEDNPQITAVGINCTSPKYIPSLIHAAKKMTNKPLLAYPNSGESFDAVKKDWNNDPISESFGEEARKWYDAGARLIGGCCRSTPEDIQSDRGLGKSPVIARSIATKQSPIPRGDCHAAFASLKTAARNDDNWRHNEIHPHGRNRQAATITGNPHSKHRRKRCACARTRCGHLSFRRALPCGAFVQWA